MDSGMVSPAYLSVPSHAVSSAAAEVIDFAAEIGFTLDAEQVVVLEALLAEDGRGRWAALQSVLICSRQNMKTFLFELIAMYGAWILRDPLTVWTAHDFDVAMESFRHIRELAESHAFLSRHVKSVTTANGQERIELHGGVRIRFKARTKTGGRGLTGDRVILDEGFALTPSIMGSLMPTMSAKSVHGNPQILVGSSAGRVESDTLRGYRNRGRAGDPTLTYVEFCAPVTACALDACDHTFPAPAGCALDARRLWKLANPAMGVRIAEDFVEEERKSMTPEEFARERLGWWDEPDESASGVDLALWESRRTAAVSGAPAGWAVDVTPDSRYASVARAVACADGFNVEVVRHARGTAWVAAAVAELVGGMPVAVDVRGPASVVVPDLVAAGVGVLEPSSVDVAQACAALLDGLHRGTVGHASQPNLDAAVRGAVRSSSSDSWKWSRKSSETDISPLVAVTLALWAAAQVPEPAKPVFAY